jgi:hypothetical protein
MAKNSAYNVAELITEMGIFYDMEEFQELHSELTATLLAERLKIDEMEGNIPEFYRPLSSAQFIPHEKISPSADKKIREISRLTQCYALAESGGSPDKPEIIRILSPDTTWLNAWTAARALECDVYEVMVKVGYEILPEIRPFRLHSQLGDFPKESVKELARVEFKDKVPADFREIEIDESIKARFKGSHTTLFRCVMDSETGTVAKVFSDDMPWPHIVKLAILMEYHVFHIRASMTFTLGKWAKRVKTFEELRKG